MKEQLISRVRLFEALPRSEIEYLAQTLRPRDFPEDTLLFREGTVGELFYILLEGQVEIIKALGTDAERILGLRQPGSFIGEMSLFSREGLRTASVRARTHLHTLEMTRSDFDALLTRQPTLAYAMTRILSQRLEDSEARTIQDLLEKHRQLSETYEHLKAAQTQIIEKEKLEAEIAIARNIQRSILPQTPPRLIGFELGARIESMVAVGGDFYDFIDLGPDQVGVVVGDVSGHGVSAAIFMALTFSLLHAEASRAQSPGEALANVNRHLLDMNNSGMFVTVLYGILNRLTREFRYARAGHDRPIVLDAAGHVLGLPVSLGQILGVLPKPILDEEHITLPTGSALLIFTDGATEANDGHGQFFGPERLATVLRDCQALPAQTICDQIWTALRVFSPEGPPADDVTLVVIKVD